MKEARLTHDLAGESFPALTEDGAWCFFADPRAVYWEGEYQKTYIGWLTREGHVMAGSYDHQTGQIASVMLKHGLQKDDHANPAIHIDAEGFVTVYYSAHNGDHMYYRKSLSPEDISGWGPERKLVVNTEGRFGFTYPNPVYLLSEAKQFLFWRGGDFKPNYSQCSHEGEWEPARTLIQGSGARPYIKYATDSNEKIYFAFTDGHPNVEPANSIYCAYYSQGLYLSSGRNPHKGYLAPAFEPCRGARRL
ncbi:BNR-4 repeat-containing protein [Paenibacillus aurantius]|uniref:BNR-4 repeat-containing protein n=1 Tax=Paenibacillus aurantius TaxID=2918900 RepID=A0AA96L9M7_9BACL|nr:BNR-4 repeat-containing protein [Paenibacillus aurantius]WNQ09562.1 BNR-4 repeat-containing protein [Paenibacillus aurantius]